MSDIPSPTPSPAEIAELIPGLESDGPLVGILMGSESDRPVMEKACAELDAARALVRDARDLGAPQSQGGRRLRREARRCAASGC